MKSFDIKTFLFIGMFISYAFTVGTLVNTGFIILGRNETSIVRMLIISSCFYISGRIFQYLFKRKKNG